MGFNSMGLLYPGALAFFAIVPALILAYLARERPRQATVSSVIAFRALHVMRGQRFLGRPRFTWTFFLELLVLCLAVLAMAGPYFLRRGNPVAVVLDNSAAMQAQTPAGKTRFASAIAAVDNALDRTAGSGQVTIYLTAPQPHQLGGAMSGSGAAVAAMARIAPVDAPDDPAATAALLAQLNSDSHIGQIVFATYRPIAAPVSPRVLPIVIGDPIANYAIGSFALSRETFGAAKLHARITIGNFSPAAQTLHVAITGDGKPIGSAQATVAAGAVTAVEFPNLAPAGVYRAELNPADGFMLDNVAYATGSAVHTVAVLFISPTPADGQSLATIPGLSVTTRTPATYTPSDLANSDLAIFEYTAPKELPSLNSLLVMPLPGDPIFNFAVASAPHVEVAGWPTTDALTDGVNFRLLNLRSGEYVADHPWMHAVVIGNGGGLLLSGDRAGHRFVATGFNPFPYLGRANLPMSILTLNLLGYLAGFGAQTAGYRTGEPWIVPAGVKAISLPSGRRHSVEPGTLFTDVTAQGVYELIGTSGAKTPRAVNLADLSVSALQSAPPISMAPAPAAPAATAGSIVRAPLAPYLFIAIVALIIAESFLVYRRRRVFAAQP
jgi:hypothetical protein